MAKNGRTYTAVVSSLETHIEHIREDITEIKMHLKESNDQTRKQGLAIAKNKANIHWIIKIGTGIAFVILSLMAIAAGLARIF